MKHLSVFNWLMDKVKPKQDGEEVKVTDLQALIRNNISDFGEHGATADDLLRRLDYLPYSSVTARFSELERKGLIVRTGEKRRGRSGRKQMVMWATSLKTVEGKRT